ncbi:MAG: hypothetical protein HZB39_17460, partial [Planctomycetes bacterium]|nr:hypothetical protein [Planctomycetota bacterium]
DVEMRWQACSRDRDVLACWRLRNGGANPGGIDLSAIPSTGWSTGAEGNPLSLDTLSRPVLGATCTLETTNIPSNALFAGLLIGLPIHDPGIDLTLLGMPGCRQYALGIQGFGLAVPGPTSPLALAIPNDSGLVGLTLAAQSIAHAPHVNAFGLVTSNGLRLTLGN